MENYNYYISLTSSFVILTLIGRLIWGIITNIVDYSDMDKTDLNDKLKEFHKINPTFKKMFSMQKVKKAITYSLEHTHLSDLNSTTTGAIVGIITLFGITPFVLHTTEHIMSDWPFVCALMMTSIISSAFFTLLNIPFSYYSTFNIEERYGFNRCPKSLFFMDTFKSFIISNIMMTIFIPIIDLTLRYLYPITLIKSLAISAVIIALFFAIETFHMTIGISMFNKLEPLKNKNLTKKINALFKKCGYRKNPRLFVIDESKRSSHQNAWVGGFGSNKKIVFYDTLLKNMTDDEIIAILGHEIGHEKNGDLIRNRITSYIEIFAMSALITTLMYNVDFLNAFGFRWINENNIHIYSTLGFFMAYKFILTFTQFLNPIESYMSRKAEYKADEYSIRMTNKGNAMISSIAKLNSSSLSDIFPSRLYEMFNYSHPSIVNRVNAMKKVMKDMKKGGK